ncbi:hypothetical protein HFP15_28020 [Amycolatopsis sp. K13G38]|uniref:Uncharacterized protein n=1 Tax=Amycolatopsis acididurans TaxID=2724524 RepID=A0ABX1JAB0_9PSEU|nr:hypothetical protein [Amycolatopsis acididurans]NKQ56727.1 hypothetical protein [Amycolatopsis acididurans]
MTIKVGVRLASAVCDTQVIVVRPPAQDVTITCGGAPMYALGQTPPEVGAAEVDRERATLMGKRYIHPELGLELLCTKPGDGTLRANGALLELKQAKSLPSSD